MLMDRKKKFGWILVLSYRCETIVLQIYLILLDFVPQLSYICHTMKLSLRIPQEIVGQGLNEEALTALLAREQMSLGKLVGELLLERMGRKSFDLKSELEDLRDADKSMDKRISHTESAMGRSGL